ncbi:protein-glutamine gamma-glutamyltransferase 5 [Lampris incognitus]|uniref:protein-glutamine gamma-glutamyltransferase 5 n=1 Tax=Lampris incognitus TaxID=2546036 RepID=UPI0024B620A4|nr:protein-glutamine gamma-glutamyltransferase 5 [Lampris incognitus]
MDLMFKKVDFHCKDNNSAHHTSEITVDQLIVRRGQSFLLTFHLPRPFNPHQDQLLLTALTGTRSSEERGTLSVFGIPEDAMPRSLEAKAVWRAELHNTSDLSVGRVTLAVTPPADSPVGKYFLTMKKSKEEASFGSLVVLFNPWCSDDCVFMIDEDERQEYVMNEQGIIYKGTDIYITSIAWDFGQFEEDVVDICLKLLDVNPKNLRDPADDVSARCNPIYVSRVVSAMINSYDDRGVLVGSWGDNFRNGVLPSRWNGSVTILQLWHQYNCHPVKYGQCWVFAGVMCTVMRCLGIPCRVVTNYQSAHDTNKSLTIDIFHSDHGVKTKKTKDSVWNYHVWVEAWMKRPDLNKDGSYDGWQVLDPTPQERSKGVFCCGPASVIAIKNGDTHLKYDVPFVFAEVNADCIDWLITANGSKETLWSDTKRIGQHISTKSVGSSMRRTITDSYKHREGTTSERATFKHAITREYSREGHVRKEVTEAEGGVREEMNEVEGPADGVIPPREVSMRIKEKRFEGNLRGLELKYCGGWQASGIPLYWPSWPLGGSGATVHWSYQGGLEDFVHFCQREPEHTNFISLLLVSKPMNGKDINLNLVLHSMDQMARPLFINISIQAMRYTGTPAEHILTEVREKMLQPGQNLSIPILIPFSMYGKHMVYCDSLKVSAIATDKMDPKQVYLTESNIVVQDPPLSITVLGQATQYRELTVDVTFLNPLSETLKNCTITVSGSGLIKRVIEGRIGALRQGQNVRFRILFAPYKAGLKTLLANFDCPTFRDIKSSCTIDVKPHRPFYY